MSLHKFPIVSFEKPHQKLVLRVSSGVPNTSKQLKHSACGLVLSLLSRCLEPLMKHEARVFDILHKKCPLVKKDLAFGFQTKTNKN